MPLENAFQNESLTTEDCRPPVLSRSWHSPVSNSDPVGETRTSSAERSSKAAPPRSAERVKGKRDGLVGRQQPAFLPGLGEGSFIQLCADGSECLFVHLREPWAQAGSELLVQSLRAGQEPGSRSRSSYGGEDAGDASEPSRDSNWIAKVAVDAMALLQHRDGVVDSPLVDGDHRQRTERRRFDVLVGERTRPTKVVLVQCSAAFAVAQPVAHPRKHASRHERVLLVAELTELSCALVEELPRPYEIVFIGDSEAEQESGLGGAPCIPERAMERKPLLGPKRRRRSVSETDRHVGRSVERFGTGRRRTIVGAERALETTTTLRQMALLVPEPRHGSCEPQGKFALA